MRRMRAGWSVQDFEALHDSRAAPNDYEITRVIVRGGKQTITIDCHARPNVKWHASAGDVDTACPASIAAQMIAGGAISTPGVWAMSPMFIVCHEERSTMRRGRLSAAKSWGRHAVPASAAVDCVRKVRRFMVSARTS